MACNHRRKRMNREHHGVRHSVSAGTARLQRRLVGRVRQLTTGIGLVGIFQREPVGIEARHCRAWLLQKGAEQASDWIVKEAVRGGDAGRSHLGREHPVHCSFADRDRLCERSG